MKLTRKEQEICEKYRTYNTAGKVRCRECPLAVDIKCYMCKANMNEEEWKEYQEGKR